MAEGGSLTDVCASVQSGTLERDVMLTVRTSDGTATSTGGPNIGSSRIVLGGGCLTPGEYVCMQHSRQRRLQHCPLLIHGK